MPFTFAHPAAILPLRRFKFLQTVPLVIGSLTPDVPHFLPYKWAALFSDTHSIYGSFVICLPLGMAILLLTLLTREPLTILLGPRLRWLAQRSVSRFFESPLHWPIALFSVLVGTWTHLAWDSFTHPAGWTTLRVPALSAPVAIFGWQTETYHLLQYLSSVFGLVVLALWLRGMLARVPATVRADASGSRGRWIVLALILCIALSIGATRAIWSLNAGLYYRTGFLFLTRSIGWFLAMYLLAGIVVVLGRRPQWEPAS